MQQQELSNLPLPTLFLVCRERTLSTKSIGHAFSTGRIYRAAASLRSRCHCNLSRNSWNSVLKPAQ